MIYLNVFATIKRQKKNTRMKGVLFLNIYFLVLGLSLLIISPTSPAARALVAAIAARWPSSLPKLSGVISGFPVMTSGISVTLTSILFFLIVFSFLCFIDFPPVFIFLHLYNIPFECGALRLIISTKNNEISQTYYLK